MANFLAIDLGTTGCRSLICSEKLQILGECYREYGMVTPQEGWVEQDADLWWTLSLETARVALAASGIDGREIDGISVSSQGITIVPVDEAYAPLCPALSWLDMRATEEVGWCRENLGFAQLFRLTGKRIGPAYTLPKLLWLRRHKPEIYAAAWKFLMPMDFLLAKLTGRCVTDHSMASGTMLYDLEQQCWNGQLLSAAGLTEERLPKLCWSGDCVGAVLPEVAEVLGLRQDCPVAVGAQDQKCADLGVGLREGGTAISLGTSAAVSRYWSRPATEQDDRIPWSAYVQPGAWVTEGVVNTAATCLRWVRDTMFPGESYDVLNQEAAEAQKRGDAALFLPYLSGDSEPCPYDGATGCFYGLNLGTGRGSYALAVMEGVAFQLRAMLEAMGAADHRQTLVLFGGGSKGTLWCQIIADITGMQIMVPETSEAAAMGAAILAGMPAGIFSWENPPAVSYGKIYNPGARAPHYQNQYERFLALGQKLWK